MSKINVLITTLLGILSGSCHPFPVRAHFWLRPIPEVGPNRKLGSNRKSGSKKSPKNATNTQFTCSSSTARGLIMFIFFLVSDQNITWNTIRLLPSISSLGPLLVKTHTGSGTNRKWAQTGSRAQKYHVGMQQTPNLTAPQPTA